MSPRSQSPLSLEYILLGFLEQTPAHGYDLYKTISRAEGVSLIWHIKQSRMYALLEKLEADGMLESTLVYGETPPLRKEYAMTSLGRQAFTTWMTSPVAHGREMRQEFLARLYFARRAGAETALELIEKQRAACMEWLEDLQRSLAQVTGQQRCYERVVFQFRISQIEAMLAWLGFCRKELS